jgi:ABC-type multidrug transport system ATPase subunit
VQIASVEPYANQIAYIMQDDILMDTMTPRESFTFSANMRLRLSAKERLRRINGLIEQLGLTECCDTKIGSNLRKGISGGERKRTSIGIELITDPSVIFLDEPTTGLDSTTALQVVLLLRQLANEGRTIVSTIHQPSSEVFYEFDRLLLIVEGRCIYKGDCKES